MILIQHRSGTKRRTIRIQRDAEDRNSIRKTLETCIDLMDPDLHEAGVLLNISTGKIAQPEVNVDRSLEIGKEQPNNFETTCARGILLQALQACGDL